MNPLKKAMIATTAICLAVVAAGLSYAQRNSGPQAIVPANYAASAEWPNYGHDSGGVCFSPLTQITPANVGNLRVAWVYHLKPEDYVTPQRGGRGGRGAEDSGAPDEAGRGGFAGRGGPGGRGGGAGFAASEGTSLVVGGI